MCPKPQAVASEKVAIVEQGISLKRYIVTRSARKIANCECSVVTVRSLLIDARNQRPRTQTCSQMFGDGMFATVASHGYSKASQSFISVFIKKMLKFAL